MMAFGRRAWYIIEGRMDKHLYKFILEIFTIHNYNLDPNRARMVGITTISTPLMVCTISGLEFPLNTSGHFSNNAQTNL
jgi:hypothetical protein